MALRVPYDHDLPVFFTSSHYPSLPRGGYAASSAKLASILLLWVETLSPHTPDASSLLFRFQCKCHPSQWFPAYRVQKKHSSYSKTHLCIVFLSYVYHFLNTHGFAYYPSIHHNVSSMEAEKKPGIVHTQLQPWNQEQNLLCGRH